jgi:Probable zinc-ribbon domain
MPHKEEWMLNGFGKNDPHEMPEYLFSGALHIDYSTAVRADIANQDFTVCPRHWYIDAAFRCPRCNQTFVFSAEEQRFWYEELKFYVDSRATRCKECRKELRHLKTLQQEYDRDIVSGLASNASIQQKTRLISVVDGLTDGGVKLPEKILDNRRVLQQQIETLRRPGTA